MPTIPGDKPCPNCHNKGVAKYKCEKCGTIWCSKCKNGVAGGNGSCPSCKSTQRTQNW